MSESAPMLLPRSEEIALRQIAIEPRPCQCQFNPHDVAMLGARGFITIAVCNVTGHGGLSLTDGGRSALSAKEE